MSSKSKRILPLYVVLIMYLIINTLFRFTHYKKIYVFVINPLLLFLISLLTYFFTKDFRNRNKNKYSKRQNVIIIVISYCLIYYLSGLIFGFFKNSYSLTINGIISNFFSFFVIAILQEYIRYRVVNLSKSRFSLVFITLILILMDINLVYLLGISNKTMMFQYFLESVLPIVILNITLTYMVCNIDFLSSLLYRCVVVGISLFSPIIPRHEWIITNFLYFMILLATMYSVDSLLVLEDKRTRKRERQHDKIFWPLFVVAFLFILFVIGIFKYQPIAIMSNSMEDYFSRGDVVIIEKMKDGDLDIEKGNVIYYNHNNNYITHRVVDIQKRNNTCIYYTKGDNNDNVDPWEVSANEVKGIVRLKIKYLGWLSVWLYELLQ